MTFNKFEEIFRSKYPDGVIAMHGKAGGTEKNKKVYVAFQPSGKAYMYYGAYEDVLCKMGFNVISKERLAEVKLHLETEKERHGKPNMFFGGVVDNSEEIARLEKMIAEYESGEWIIA